MIEFWMVINTVFSIALSLVVVHELVQWYDKFSPTERTGMGILAGGVLLTIPTLWVLGPTPFDYWTLWLVRLGATIYFVGRLIRHRRHFRNNERMKEAGRKHAQARADRQH